MNEKGEGEIVSLVVLGLIIWGCMWGYNNFIKADKWSLIYLNNFNMSVVAGDYPSREACAQKLEVAKRNKNMNRPECGSNCKPSKEFTDMYVCDETFEL